MDVVFGESHVWDSVVDDGAYGYYDVINIDDVPESMVVHNSKGGFWKHHGVVDVPHYCTRPPPGVLVGCPVCPSPM